jgi:hypothetical protein
MQSTAFYFIVDNGSYCICSYSVVTNSLSIFFVFLSLDGWSSVPLDVMVHGMDMIIREEAITTAKTVQVTDPTTHYYYK